jgi:radical SAM-linked protein
VRFVSHRDVARIWERALRRADLPIAYTEGFSPRPKLSFGLALGTAYESRGEYLDISLRDGAPRGDVACEQLPALLNPVLPTGIELQAVVELPSGETSLQQAVTSCTWHIELAGSATAASVAEAVEQVMTAEELVITRERKGETVSDDIRPSILASDVLGTLVETELATQPRALRPAEYISALHPEFSAGRVTRINQWTQADGARHEVIPLDAGATQAAHALERAS